MQLSYYPAPALRITGSEESATHKGTMCLDQALNSTNPINDPWLYAPFDCKIWRIYSASNGLFLTSVEPVQTPKFVDHVSFYIGHMNDEDFLPMKYAVGQIIKQGQKFYREGVKGFATGEHVHLNFGRGAFIGNGWAKNTDENWGLTTTLGETHIWDTTYLKTGTPKYVGTTAASGYPWEYEPIPAPMKSVSNMSITTSDVIVNIRWKPSTKFAAIGKIPANTKVSISEQSISEADGFNWVKLSGSYVGYAAMVSSMKLIDEAAEAAKISAEKEAARLAAEKAAADKLASEEAARLAALKAEADAKLAAEKEAARLEAIKESERLAAEVESARLAAEAEAKRLAAEQEAIRLAAEAEANRLAAEKEAIRLAAEAEVNRLAAERESIRLAAEAEAERLRLEQLAKEEAAIPVEPEIEVSPIIFKVPTGGFSIMRIASLFRVNPKDIYSLNKDLIHISFNKSLPIGMELKLPINAVEPYSKPISGIVVGSRVKIVSRKTAFGFPIPPIHLARSHVVVKIVGNYVTLDSALIVNIQDIIKA